MALTKAITTNQGFAVPESYTAIIDFESFKDTTEGVKTFNVHVHLNTYKDSTKEVCLYGTNLTVVLPYNEGTIDMADLYTEIKLLPEFEGYADA